MLIGVKKYISVEKILLLKVRLEGGGEGGYQLKVQGMDSYPVNECTYVFLFQSLSQTGEGNTQDSVS